MTVRSGDVASAIGKGVVAGVVGTAVLTAAQRIEMWLSGREGSSAPAEAVERVLDLEPRSDKAEERLSQLTHWAYGTSWGAVRGLLAGVGLKGPAATLTHFGLVWGSALGMLPALGVAPPPHEWGKEEVLKDAGFHALYALATGLAYAYLEAHE